MVIVLAVDKDNDYGRKAGVKCPVIGENDVLNAVNALALADPEDSDVNVGFAAVKIAREVGGIPVIVCGEGKNSFRDDLEIARELDEIRKRFDDTDVIVVTDGAEDESIIPIISSRFRVVGVERVTVKQLEGVETVYYIIVKYLKEILSSRETAKIFLGIPGIILLFIGLSTIISTWYPWFYSAVKNFIIGLALLLFGGYIFKVGFGVEFTKPMRKDFIVASTYIIMIFTVVIAVIHGVQKFSQGHDIPGVVGYSINTAFIILLIYAFGQIVSEYMNGRKKLYYYLSFMTFLPAIYGSVVLIERYVLFGRVDVIDFFFYGAVIVLSVILSGLIFRKGKRNIY